MEFTQELFNDALIPPSAGGIVSEDNEDILEHLFDDEGSVFLLHLSRVLHLHRELEVFSVAKAGPSFQLFQELQTCWIAAALCELKLLVVDGQGYGEKPQQECSLEDPPVAHDGSWADAGCYLQDEAKTAQGCKWECSSSMVWESSFIGMVLFGSEEFPIFSSPFQFSFVIFSFCNSF